MKNKFRVRYLAGAIVTAFVIVNNSSLAQAKHKEDANQDGPTARLFQLLDSTHGGKLDEFYLLGDPYKDSTKPEEEFRHVLRVDYDKSRGFGRLNLYVRSVGQMDKDQLSAYTPKQIYEYGEVDLEKFVKTTPGSFGGPGDVYLRSPGDTPLASTHVTDEARKEYEGYIIQYILPALQKK